MDVRMDLAQELLRRELIGSDELEEALRLQEREGLRLDQVLLRARRIDEPALLQVIGDLLAIPFVPEVAALEIDPRALEDLPPKVVFRRRIVPIARANGSLRVVTSDAYDLYAFDEARMLTGLRIEPVLAPQAEVDKLIKTHYGVGGDTVDAMMGVGETESASTSEGSQDLLEMAEEASVIRLVNEIIVEAIHERASDIHIEPYEHELAIRYRIDGVLQPAKLPPEIRRFQAAILSRIKILANMNIAEKRLPQDGRIQLTVGGRQVDLRVSVIPMLFGEGIVMRVLDKDSVLFTLPELGMDEESYRRFVGLIERPHGIILVTGPTGSGKTTTLYAALHAIVGPEKKVLTVEDPVEYHLEGVNQIPVVPSIGMTFERGLRAILRHDPDVVMIGEIR
ncbi:MAG TPA: ATPase, T2SS/T4P/T4SS family, partial [Planctomycetota bacterium]|nr:ATPase, T2SS/T4P/T4SS family [Planctomycetota bacterium]